MKNIRPIATRPPHHTGGYLLLLALAIGAVFATVLGALAGYAVLRDKAAHSVQSGNEALALAEGGLARYGWTLEHAPDAPYAGDTEVSMQATPSTTCGTTTSVSVRATGTPADGNGVSATVSVRFVRELIKNPCATGEEATSTPVVSPDWNYADWRQE